MLSENKSRLAKRNGQGLVLASDKYVGQCQLYFEEVIFRFFSTKSTYKHEPQHGFWENAELHGETYIIRPARSNSNFTT